MAIKAKSAQEVFEAVAIEPLITQTLQIRLVGDSPLIVHAWSEKAKKEMLEKQQKIKSNKKLEIRDPQAEYEAAFYHYPGGGYGFPALGIKGALIGMAHKDLGIEKTLIRKALYIQGKLDKNGMQLIKIYGEPNQREDMVTIGMGSSDLRYRPEFRFWYMDVEIKYDVGLILPNTVVNLLNRAGFSVGLGEWRPEKSGQFGMFHLGGSAEPEDGAELLRWLEAKEDVNTARPTVTELMAI